MKHYYLLSLKHSKNKNEYVWWQADDSGYTTDINQAGIYSEERINSRKRYYSNTGTMPVPVEIVEQTKKMTIVPTLDDNYKLLGIREFLKTAKEY
jgi:hypothetical protein